MFKVFFTAVGRNYNAYKGIQLKNSHPYKIHISHNADKDDLDSLSKTKTSLGKLIIHFEHKQPKQLTKMKRKLLSKADCYLKNDKLVEI